MGATAARAAHGARLGWLAICWVPPRLVARQVRLAGRSSLALPRGCAGARAGGRWGSFGIFSADLSTSDHACASDRASVAGRRPSLRVSTTPPRREGNLVPWSIILVAPLKRGSDSLGNKVLLSKKKRFSC